MEYTTELSRYIADLSWNSIPAMVIERGKINILDTLGVAVRGSATPHARAAFTAISRLGGNPQAAVIGREGRTSMTQAALLNGLSAHGIDFDDSHKFVHPGSAVIAATLAVAEGTGATGRDCILATIAGYDTAVRISLAAGVPHRKKGFHPTGTCNFPGAAAAAAKILGLDAGRTAAALSIAATQAAGLCQYRIDGSATKHFHAGMAAQGGTLAALLADAGFIGTANILEGELGFLRLLADGGDLEKLLADLGRVFSITETDIKPYPSCRQTHAVLDMALEAAKLPVDTAAIRDIRIEIYEYATARWYAENTPRETGLQAMLNIPYCAASALVHGSLSLDSFGPDMLANTAVTALAAKISVVAAPDLSAAFPAKRGARLRITMADGTEHAFSRDNPRGASDSPLSFADVREKFMLLTAPLLGDKQAREAATHVENLETIQDISLFAKYFQKTSA